MKITEPKFRCGCNWQELADFFGYQIDQYDQDNLTKKEELRNDIRNEILSQKELNSENHQILGLIDYESKDWKNNSDRILENFTKSVEKDQTNFLAQLYLAHIYHDTGNLKLALENYLKVDTKALKKFQIWRYVKLIEQIGYCTFKLGNETSGTVFFEKVLKWYKRIPENELARPTELLQCLPKDHRIVIEIKKIEDYLE